MSDPSAYSLSGFFVAQLAIAVPGVVVITSEYATRIDPVHVRLRATARPQW